jgi:hypothetical protein
MLPPRRAVARLTAGSQGAPAALTDPGRTIIAMDTHRAAAPLTTIPFSTVPSRSPVASLRVAVSPGLDGLRAAIDRYGDGRYVETDDLIGADVIVTDTLDAVFVAGLRAAHPRAVILVVTTGSALPARVAACLGAGADAVAPATPRVLVAHLDALARRRAVVHDLAG